jgi:hypothetical protein
MIASYLETTQDAFDGLADAENEIAWAQKTRDDAKYYTATARIRRLVKWLDKRGELGDYVEPWMRR